ncbi:hypothetical protein K492DRAFT_181749 [Lichtheimia hyalospora FSU 10163]|nr:hypothetical protein K492DRAFT_181749 [Lichtheimia hyalospora FSU 10163]
MRTLQIIPLSVAALALLVQAAPIEQAAGQGSQSETQHVQIYNTGNEAAENHGALQNQGEANPLGNLVQGLSNVKRDDDDDDDDEDDDDDDDDEDDDDDDDDDEDDDDGDDTDDKDDDPDGNPNDDNDQLKKGGGGPPLLAQEANSLLKALSPSSHGYGIAGIIKKRKESASLTEDANANVGPHIQKLKAHHHKDADGEDPGDGIHGDDDDDDDDDDDGDDDRDEA